MSPDPYDLKWITPPRKPRHQGRYLSLIIGSMVAFDLLLNTAMQRGIELPTRNGLARGEWLVPVHTFNRDEWLKFLHRHDVHLAAYSTWIFKTSGSSLVLPSDFNVGNNAIYGIGAGASGYPLPTSPYSTADNGGGGGAFSLLVNYSNHGPGDTVGYEVGAGDTVFDSTAIFVAKAASLYVGGQASACVGTTCYSGGNGGQCPQNCFSGAGGGGAAGPSGAGFSAASPTAASNQPTAGAAGDAGNGGQGGPAGVQRQPGNIPGGPGGNGTEINGTAGSGGGGGGGISGLTCECDNPNAGDGGAYGGGGGGAGTLGTGGGSCGGADPEGDGAGYQGLLAIAYNPLTFVPTTQAMIVF